MPASIAARSAPSVSPRRRKPAAPASCHATGARLARHRAARLRRDIDELVAPCRSPRSASGRARSRARPAPAARSAPPARPPKRGSPRCLDDDGQRLIERGVRIALGQQPQMRGKRQQAVDGERALQQPRGIEGERLGLESAEMLVEPRAPGQRHRLPGCSTGCCLRERPPRTRPRWRPCARVITSRMALVSPCLPGAEHDAFVLPFHAGICAGRSGMVKAAGCRWHQPSGGRHGVGRRCPTA